MTRDRDIESPRLLVIDDDPILLKLFEVRLKTWGFNVTTAENGAVARQIVEQGTFEAISVDLMMPVIDGLRFLKWLREEQKSDVPVIVFTSHYEQTMLNRVSELGVQHVMSKPLDVPHFLDTLNSIFKVTRSNPVK